MGEQSREHSQRRAILVTATGLIAFGASAARGLWAETPSPDAARPASAPAAKEGTATGRTGLDEAGTAWEDMLLLQAMRYLRLSSAQMQELLPLARAANRQLSALQLREEKTLESIRRIAARQRDALLTGGKTSLQEQADAISLRDAAARSRAETENAIVSTAVGGLARTLTPKQIERAFLLTQGLAPEGEPRETALLDLPAGFVAGGFDGGPMVGGRGPAGPAIRRGGPGPGNPPSLAQQLMETQFHLSMVQRTLSEGFPPGAVGGAVFQSRDGQPTKVFRFGGPGEPLPGAPALGAGPKTLPLPPGAEVLDEAAFREHLSGEVQALSAQVSDLRRQLFNPEGAVAPDQYEVLLRPLARRLFLSARLQQTLESRLRVKEYAPAAPRGVARPLRTGRHGPQPPLRPSRFLFFPSEAASQPAFPLISFFLVSRLPDYSLYSVRYRTLFRTFPGAFGYNSGR